MWPSVVSLLDWFESKFSENKQTVEMISPIEVPIQSIEVNPYPVALLGNNSFKDHLSQASIWDENQKKNKHSELAKLLGDGFFDNTRVNDISLHLSFRRNRVVQQEVTPIEDYLKSDQETHQSDVLNAALVHACDDVECSVVVTLCRNVEGKEQTLYLLGGQHITKSNTISDMPDTVFSDIDCLCFEDIDPDATSYPSYDELYLSATKFYGMSLSRGEPLYGFESEIQKKVEHHNPGIICIKPLEDRKATVQHFNFLSSPPLHSDEFLLALRAMYGAKTFDMYRNDSMAKNLQCLMKDKSRMLAAVGMTHLPQIISMLLASGFKVTEEDIYGQVPMTSHNLTP